MLAIEAMDPTVQGIFYLIAVVLFVLTALGVVVQRVHLGWAGLAFVAFVFMWNGFAAG